MQAVFYTVNPVGWATCKWLKHLWPGCVLSRLNGLSLREIEPHPLPADDWVRVKTLLGGICGSDVALVAQRQPPNSILQAFSSMPFVFGHENVSVVDALGPDVPDIWKGRRVCVEPTLACQARGITPLCRHCRQGNFCVCENFGADGAGKSQLPPGTSIGYNARTGGSKGEYFVAHVSQLVPVPDGVCDELALLTDPAACALHGVLRTDLSQVEKILVYGAGTIGLCTVASLRAVGYDGRIDVIARHDYQTELAESLGADECLILPPARRLRFEQIARMTGAKVHRVRFGNRTLTGGYDVTCDCVGSKQSLNECLKWTRGRGQMVLVGTGHGGGVDLTSIWFSELKVFGAYGRQVENYDGRKLSTYKLVHEFMVQGKLPLEPLLTHRFPIGQYRRAYGTALHKSANKAVKVAFDFRNKQREA